MARSKHPKRTKEYCTQYGTEVIPKGVKDYQQWKTQGRVTLGQLPKHIRDRDRKLLRGVTNPVRQVTTTDSGSCPQLLAEQRMTLALLTLQQKFAG